MAIFVRCRNDPDKRDQWRIDTLVSGFYRKRYAIDDPWCGPPASTLAAAAVAGLPDATYGEVVAAWVAPGRARA